jgi:hypothetical protein
MFGRCKKFLVLRNQLTHHFFWDFAEQWFSPHRRILNDLEAAKNGSLFAQFTTVWQVVVTVYSRSWAFGTQIWRSGQFKILAWIA